MAVSWLLGLAGCFRYVFDDGIAANVNGDLLQHGFLKHASFDVCAAYAVVAGVALPWTAVWRLHQPGQQVVRYPCTGHPARFVAIQPRQDGLGFAFRNEGGMGIPLDDPFVAWAALAPVGGLFLSPAHVPDGVACIGQHRPFQVRQATFGHVDAQLVGQLAPISPPSPALQPCSDLRTGDRIYLEAAFSDGLAVADRAGIDGDQFVAIGGAASGAVSLADVFGHAGEAFFAAHQAMHFVHGLQYAVKDYLTDWINLGNFGEQDLYAEFLAFVAESFGDIAPPADAAGVINQHHPPGAAFCFQITQELLKSGSVCAFAAFYGVAVFSGYDNLARSGKFE